MPKKKRPPPMLAAVSVDLMEASYAVGAGHLVLGQGAMSKTGGKEIEFTESGITYGSEEKKLSESAFERWAEGETTFLGRGAAGMVELMREKASGQAVAVKHMNMTAKSDRDQTIEEVRSMWRLDHANVVRFYGAYFCAKDQTVCFVLEYMNSNSLQHILKNCRQTPMAEPVVGRLVADILEGVKYLHSAKIIHRDLKPGNVLCHDNGQDMTVKVADFGIVKTMEDAMFATTGVGTVAYMSPERLEINHDVGYSYATDLWAVGLIAGECATGQHLYPPDVQHVQFDFIVYVKSNPTPNVDPTMYSPELRDLIALCLKKDPAERPSAADMLNHPYTLAHCDVALARTVDSRTKLEFLEVRLTERIVRACVEHYYSMLESQPAELVSLYLEDSTCTVVNDGSVDGPGKVYQGPDTIVTWLGELARTRDAVAVVSVEPKQIDRSTFLCAVSGTFTAAGGGATQKFAQVFTFISSGLALHIRHELQYVIV